MNNVINFQRKKGEKIMNSTARRITGEPLGQVVSRNINYLYNKQWKQKEKQGQTVYNAARGTVSPRVITLELIADRAKIPAWYLLLPLSEDLLQSTELADLVYSFINLNPLDRNWVLETIHRIKY